jgi:hypothetical protein
MNKNPNARFTVSQVREMLENQMDDDTKNKFVLTIKQENAKKAIVEEQKSSKIESKTKQKIHDYTETLSSICSIA